MAYAPVGSNIERKYYLTTLGELYGSDKVPESVAKYRSEVDAVGSFQVAEELWSLNKNAELEVVHRKLLAERIQSLEKAPSIEAKVTSNAIKSWLVVTLIVYAFLVLFWRGARKVYRNWWGYSEGDSGARSKNSGPNRSKAGWGGRL